MKNDTKQLQLRKFQSFRVCLYATTHFQDVPAWVNRFTKYTKMFELLLCLSGRSRLSFKVDKGLEDTLYHFSHFIFDWINTKKITTYFRVITVTNNGRMTNRKCSFFKWTWTKKETNSQISFYNHPEVLQYQSKRIVVPFDVVDLKILMQRCQRINLCGNELHLMSTEHFYEFILA